VPYWLTDSVTVGWGWDMQKSVALGDTVRILGGRFVGRLATVDDIYGAEPSIMVTLLTEYDGDWFERHEIATL
jgi:hypothetical protein